MPATRRRPASSGRQNRRPPALSLNGKQLATVFRIKALRRLRCYVLSVCGFGEGGPPKFLPRPVSPGLFQSWELAASRWSAVHSQLAGAERAPTCSILGPPQCDARSRLPSGWWGAAHAQKQRSSSRLSLRRRRRPQAEAKKLATSGYAGDTPATRIIWPAE